QVHDDKRPPEPQNRPAGQQQHLTRTVDAWLCDKGGLRHVPGPVASSDARVRSEAGYHQHFRHRRTGLAVHEARSLYAHWIVARNQWDAAAQRSVEHNRATQGSRKPVSAGATLEKLHVPRRRGVMTTAGFDARQAPRDELAPDGRTLALMLENIVAE